MTIGVVLNRIRPAASATPSILQVAESDCGAACLAILLAHHGHHVPMREVREVCSVGRDGLTAADLLSAAAHYRLRARGLRLRLDQVSANARAEALRGLPTPSIVLLRGSHFVVLEGVTRRDQVALNDPAAGRGAMGVREFGEQFSGIVLTFVPGPDFRTGGKPAVWHGAYTRWLKPHQARLVLLALLGAGMGLSLAGAALALREVLLGASSAAALLPVLLVVLAGVGWARARLLSTIAVELLVEHSRTFVAKLLSLPSLFFRRRFTADVVGRVSLTETLCVLLAYRVVATITGLVAIGIVLGTLIAACWPIALVASLGLLISGGLRYGQGRASAERRERLVGIDNGRLAIAVDGLTMLESLHLEGAEQELLGRLTDAGTLQLDVRRALDRANAPWFAAIAAADVVAMTAVLATVAGGLANGWLDPSMAVAALMLTVGLVVNARSTSDSALGLPRFLRRLGWADDVLSDESDPRFAVEPGPAEQRLRGGIELLDVTFGYDRNRSPLLEDMNLIIKPGQRIVLTGPAGSGKSTLIRVLAGIQPPWSGAVLLDGRPLTTIRRGDLVRSLAYVGSHPVLLDGTVEQNVTLDDVTLDEGRVSAAIHDSGLAEVLRRRGDDRDSRVELDGGNFSVGDQQRLVLARALARDPSILLLDDPFAEWDVSLLDRIAADPRRHPLTIVAVGTSPELIRSADIVLDVRTALSVARVTRDGSW